MTDIAQIFVHNIKSVTQGTSVLQGITSITIQFDEGDWKPLIKTGKKYASGAENVGTQQFPVMTQAQVETGIGAMVTGISAARGDLTIVGLVGEGKTDETVVIGNHKFTKFGGSINRQQLNSQSISGHAHSDDGDAIPLTVTGGEDPG